MTDCTVLVLNEACLEKSFDSAPKMRFVLDCLVGEDVAKKLYAVSDVVNMSVANQRENQKPGTKNFSEMKQKRNLDFRRTASMDAIHTGGKVEKILKVNLDSILSPSPSVKIQIMGGKICLRCEDETLLGVVNKLFVFKAVFPS